jgi:hypothetical protein
MHADPREAVDQLRAICRQLDDISDSLDALCADGVQVLDAADLRDAAGAGRVLSFRVACLAGEADHAS